MISSRMRIRSILALTTMLLCVLLIAVGRLGVLPSLQPSVSTLYEWAVILAGVALLLGVTNVAWVHLGRVQRGLPGWWQSLTLVVVMVAVFVAGTVGRSGEQSPMVEWVYDSILNPGYAAMLALTVFFVAGAMYQMLRLGRPGGRWVLVGAAFIVVAQAPAASRLLPEEFRSTSLWIMEVPVSATLRGALLGIGLALLLVAIRFALGRRP
jgi:hypothetical protein